MRYGVNVDETTTHNHPNTYCNKTQKQAMIQHSTMSKTHTAWQAVNAPPPPKQHSDRTRSAPQSLRTRGTRPVTNKVPDTYMNVRTLTNVYTSLIWTELFYICGK